MKAINDGEGLTRMEHPINGFGDPYNGCARMRTSTGGLTIIFSNGEGWDHVSVSRPDRPPSWNEMSAVKARFFEPEECVVQFHPPRSRYVNNHPNCLHLWRFQLVEFPLPDSEMV